ncbi:hypothetical protein [Ralstonia sp.]|uniref:hypothetical protein n=1 Tax=Ralstonia sp. TaxID=54061 RepID=UPI0031E2CA46
MLTVLYPHLLPAIRDYPAGLMPIVLEGVDYPILVIKGMKEAILAARLNGNFKIYVAPIASGARRSIGLITAFFDIPDEPLIIRSQLFLDEDFSRKLLVVLLSDRLDVHFFDEHAREQIAYRADVLMTPEAHRLIAAAEFADQYHTDWRQIDNQLVSWFSNRTGDDDRTAIEVKLVEPLMPDDIAYIDATSDGNAYSGSLPVNVSYLVRNEPGPQQEHDIALLLQRVFPAEQIFRGALRDYDREEIADLLIVTERSLIFIQAKDSPNTESVIRNAMERKKATALKSLRRALGQLRGAVRYSKRASPMVILVDGREATVDVSMRSLYCIALVKELFNEDFPRYSSPVLQLASETGVPCVALDYAELNMYTANLRDEQSFLLAIERVFEAGSASGTLPRLRLGPDSELARRSSMSTDNDNSSPTPSVERAAPISVSSSPFEDVPDGEEGRADSVPPQPFRFDGDSMRVPDELLVRIFGQTLVDFFYWETQEILDGVNERNSCGRMAIYMQSLVDRYGLTGYIVDVEYNRKQHGMIKTIVLGDWRVVRINCDLILHSRGRFVSQDNLIAVELKKADRPELEKESDRVRLRALTKASFDGVWSPDDRTPPDHVCGYRLGAYVELDRQHRRCLVEYYSGGQMVEQITLEF